MRRRFLTAAAVLVAAAGVLGIGQGTGTFPVVDTACACTKPTFPPTNKTAPVASGTITVGNVLSTTNGTWGGTPTSYAYQWQRSPDGSTGWANLITATSSSYTLIAGDASQYIRAQVVATNADGSQTVYSNVLGPINASGGGTVANLWVDASGATPCTRSSSLISYSAAQSGGNVCGNAQPFQQAYTAAHTGDIVLVKTGSYASQNLDTDNSQMRSTHCNGYDADANGGPIDTAGCVLFEPGTGESPTFTGTLHGNGANAGFKSISVSDVYLKDLPSGLSGYSGGGIHLGENGNKGGQAANYDIVDGFDCGIGGWSVGGSGGGFLFFQKPTGLTSGDVMIAMITAKGTSTFSNPSGWVLIRDTSTSDGHMETWYKIATGSEPSNYTFLGHDTGPKSGVMLAYPNVDNSIPVVTSTGNTGTGTSVVGTGITTTNANDMVIQLSGTLNGETSYTAASGLTERSDYATTGQIDGGVTTESADKVFTSPGATGNFTATAGAAGTSWISQVIELNANGTPSFRARVQQGSAGAHMVGVLNGGCDFNDVGDPNTGTSSASLGIAQLGPGVDHVRVFANTFAHSQETPVGHNACMHTAGSTPYNHLILDSNLFYDCAEHDLEMEQNDYDTTSYILIQNNLFAGYCSEQLPPGTTTPGGSVCVTHSGGQVPNKTGSDGTIASGSTAFTSASLGTNSASYGIDHAAIDINGTRYWVATSGTSGQLTITPTFSGSACAGGGCSWSLFVDARDAIDQTVALSCNTGGINLNGHGTDQHDWTIRFNSIDSSIFYEFSFCLSNSLSNYNDYGNVITATPVCKSGFGVVTAYDVWPTVGAVTRYDHGWSPCGTGSIAIDNPFVSSPYPMNSINSPPEPTISGTYSFHLKSCASSAVGLVPTTPFGGFSPWWDTTEFGNFAPNKDYAGNTRTGPFTAGAYQEC